LQTTNNYHLLESILPEEEEKKQTGPKPKWKILNYSVDAKHKIVTAIIVRQNL
jgi:hypothetical protein